ncbi:MAG: helix-turn-helix domain-containing protein [Planctomycetota bacterium]
MLLTIAEVAERLKISPSFAYALVSRGELECYEIGNCKRVDESDLEAFLANVKKSVVRLPKSKGRHF